MALLLVVIVLQAAQQISFGNKLLSKIHVIQLQPIYILLATATATTVYYLLRRRRSRTIYLVNYACLKPIPTYRTPKATVLEHARLSPFLAGSTTDFIARLLEHSGMGEETLVPPALWYIDPYCCLDDARAESELVVFSVIDDLLAKTRIDVDAIDVLITNCSSFCPMPSITDVVVDMCFMYLLQSA